MHDLRSESDIMTFPAHAQPFLRFSDGRILQADLDGTRPRPCRFNSFPNVLSSFGETRQDGRTLSCFFYEVDSRPRATSLKQRKLTPEDSNIPVSPFLTLQSIRTDAARSFWLCCATGSIFGSPPSFGESSVFSKKYSWEDCGEGIVIGQLSIYYKLAYIEINSCRRVFVDGTDTGIWRSTGVIHEP